jgi:cytidylate kinase
MTSITPDFAIVRGAPGTGKSAVARWLSRNLPSGVYIEVDEIRRMIAGVNWTDTSVHIHAILAARALAIQFLRQAYKPVFLIDTLSGGTLGYVTDNLTYRYQVFSLVAQRDVIRHRILERQSEFLDCEKSFWVNDLIASSEPPNNHVIDTSLRSIDDVGREIAGFLCSP